MKSAYRIKENSFIAHIAAKKLRANNMAIVIGRTIHLFNATRNDLVNNDRWLRHELCHINQFKEHGFIPFIFKYVFESFKNGYYNNKYEKEARNAEKEVAKV